MLARWPDDPASWQLQWDLARQTLLDGAWADARGWLTALPEGTMPEPLEDVGCSGMDLLNSGSATQMPQQPSGAG